MLTAVKKGDTAGHVWYHVPRRVGKEWGEGRDEENVGEGHQKALIRGRASRKKKGKKIQPFQKEGQNCFAKRTFYLDHPLDCEGQL